MARTSYEEIAEVILQHGGGEVGGVHTTQGIEFQKHWAVLRMFELTEAGEKDFLFLFEALQDVAVIDSNSSPTSICIFQVKKKSRKEWSWSELTALHNPDQKKKLKPLDSVKESPLGKLYAAVRTFSEVKSSGAFISNAGCDIPHAGGGVMATSMKDSLSQLSLGHLELLRKGLETMHEAGEDLPDLARLSIERVNLSPEDPGTGLVGKVHDFLLARSDQHAGQARALVDALLAKIGPLSMKAAGCRKFDEIRQHCGFSKEQFDAALGDLEQIPDDRAGFETCMTTLSNEGMTPFEIQALRVAATGYFKRRVMGNNTPEEEKLIRRCTEWIDMNPPTMPLRSYLEVAINSLHDPATSLSKQDVIAHLLVKCLQYERPRP